MSLARSFAFELRDETGAPLGWTRDLRQTAQRKLTCITSKAELAARDGWARRSGSGGRAGAGHDGGGREWKGRA